MRNPFEDDIFSEPPAASEGDVTAVPSIHAKVLRHLTREIADASGQGLEAITGSHGHTILLTAPRAGYGKSHLLSRLETGLGKDADIVNIRFNLEEPPGWDTLLRQTLARFARSDAQEPPLARIQATGRWVFAALTARLIEAGEVPSTNPEGAVEGLRRNYLRVFDPANEDPSVLDWLTNNFEQLRPAMARILARARGATESGTAFWLDVFRETNADRPGETPEHLNGYVPDSSASGGEARIAKLRLADFCRVVSAHRPLVFLLDHLDCFHGNAREGLRIAYLLAELRTLSPGLTTILATNDDLWRSAFGDRLPSALSDRLTAIPARLAILEPGEARDLVAARCQDAGIPPEVAVHFLAGFDPGHGIDLNPRAILRKARAAWSQFVGDTPSGCPDENPQPPNVLTEGFPGGLLSDFGADIPSVSELMEAETLRRARRDTPTSGDSGPGPGFSPFLSEPEESYLNGPHSLHSILKNAPSAGEDVPEPRKLDLSLLRRKATVSSALGRTEIPGSVPAGPGLPAPRPLRQSTSAAPVNGDAIPTHPLVEKFHALRDSLLDEGPSTLDPARLRELVALCGAQSPIIDCEEIPLSDAGSGSALRWTYADCEILIAFASSGDDASSEAFWEEFLRLPENGHPGAKLVAFARPGNETEDNPVPARLKIPPRLDIITILPDTAATLRAASELIGDALAIAPASSGEALGAIADELDFFWRRLTRPLEFEHQAL